MISKKVFVGDGSNNRFLSDFIIRSEQFTRVYNYWYDPVGVHGDVHPESGLFIRTTDFPESEDIVTIDKWDLVDNSISFYVSPYSGSHVYIEVATTPDEFGDTLVQPSVEKAEEAAAAALVSELASKASENAASTSEGNAASSAAAALVSKNDSASSAVASQNSALASASSAGQSDASAAAALASKNAAATSASEALASKNAAASSESAAAISASNSQNSAVASSNSASASLSSANDAAASAAALPTIVSGDAYKFLVISSAENGYNKLTQGTAFNTSFGSAHENSMRGDFISYKRANGINEGTIDADPDTTIVPLMLTNHANSPDPTYFWHISTTFYNAISTSANKGQIAVQYTTQTGYPAKVYSRSNFGAIFTPWSLIGGEEPWQFPTLQNGWANFSTSFMPARYKKDSSNVVHINAFIKDGTAGSGDAIFTLPVGYRPDKNTVISALNANTTVYYYVNTGGEITPSLNFTPSSWLSLNFSFALTLPTT